MCAASESNAAPGGLQEHTGPEETGGPLVAGCRAGSKGWNEKGDMRPLFFLTKKTLSSIKITLHCTCKAERIPNLRSKLHSYIVRQCGAHQEHHLLLRLITWLLTCILHFHSWWLHIFLHSGKFQWAGSILDLLNKLNTLKNKIIQP